MQIQIKDVKCPICHSNNTRSKVECGGTWWYICDNRRAMPHGVVVLPSGKEWDLDALQGCFYFTENGLLETPEGCFKIGRQTVVTTEE